MARRSVEKRCSLCNAYQYDEENLKFISKRVGRLCNSCRKCNECDKPLPTALLGLKGYSHHQAKLCTRCHKKKRKLWGLIERREVPRKNLGKLLVSDESSKLSRLKSYVRLERKSADGLVTVIEFGIFCGDKIYTADKRAVYGVSTLRYIINKNGQERIDGKSIKVERRVVINMERENNADFETHRLMRRPVDWLRHLGYCVTVKKTRGTRDHVGGWEAKTYAEELAGRRNQIIEEALSPTKKKLLEKLEEKRDKVLEKLSDFESKFLDQEIDDAPSHDELEAMVSGIEVEAY